MYGYERTYRTGRAVASILEIVGWVIVAIGVISALAGLASGGFFGMASRNFGGGDTPFLLRIIAMLPGIVTAALGLFFIMQCQLTKATLDNTEMSRESLALAKGGQIKANKPDTVSRSNAGTNSVGPKQAGDRIKIFKGYEILKHANGVSVEGQVFQNVLEAERHINQQGQSTG